MLLYSCSLKWLSERKWESPESIYEFISTEMGGGYCEDKSSADTLAYAGANTFLQLLSSAGEILNCSLPYLYWWSLVSENWANWVSGRHKEFPKTKILCWGWEILTWAAKFTWIQWIRQKEINICSDLQGAGDCGAYTMLGGAFWQRRRKCTGRQDWEVG